MNDTIREKDISSPFNGIAINKVSHSFDNNRVLNEVNYQIPRGAFVAMLGPSGCGKTTLLKCIAGLVNPTAGYVTLDGLTPSDARMKGFVGFAFQSPTLLPWRTALENVLLPIEICQNNGHLDHEKEYALELLYLMGLKKDIGKLPNELSGGMQQRVGLARSLITRPSFLFLDEPFGALDGITRNELNEKLREIWQKYNLTILVVTHTIEEAIFLADKVIIFSPPPAQILHIIDINFGKERSKEIRYKKEFFEYQVAIRTLTEGLSNATK